ncbi:MAG: S-methyl-5-thioribose-1-phosphate isomerase [Bacillota bacterium]
MNPGEPLKTLYWDKGRLYLLDQRLLPGECSYLSCATAGEVAAAVKQMVVRGAPAIGISAAFGLVLAARQAAERGDGPGELCETLRREAALLLDARPTAVNLAWALERMQGKLSEAASLPSGLIAESLESEALAILEEDLATNRRIGLHGAALLPDAANVLTHCNAGALATAGYGTALAVIRAAVAEGKIVHVYVDETRPLLQGARLTALELVEEKIPATLITDNCAAFLMSRGRVDLVITGADRIAANGDTANKIGTYGLAVLARHHRIPFYIAAPCSTIDRRLAAGEQIVIEERDPTEITRIHGQALAPATVTAYNPAFDVTPAELISALITERGVVCRPGRAGIEKLFRD